MLMASLSIRTSTPSSSPSFPTRKKSHHPVIHCSQVTQYPYGPMSQDTLIRKLRFESLRVDFRSIVTNDEAEMCMFSLSQPERAVPWLEFVADIRKSTPGQKYTLQIVSKSNSSSNQAAANPRGGARAKSNIPTRRRKPPYGKSNHW